MEMITAVKSEVSSMIRRHLCSMEGDTPGAKCVKRRRRGSSTMAIGCNSQGGREQPTAAITTTAKRSSIFRGVSRHRWTGRFEAHLWDKGSWNPTQRKKGKQVYLGAYDEEESAGRAYDLAAIKYWGPTTITNFPVSDYEKEMEIMQNLTREEYLVSLRRRSSGFSRGVSKYRGVARHHHNGRWEARIGRVFGNKYLYLGTYGTQEEAARAYDIAAIENRGINTMTNFDLSTYIPWLRPSTNSLVPQTTTQSHRSPFVSLHSTIGLSDKTNFSFCPNLYTTGDLGKMVSKPEILETKMAISPFNKSSSSPTALSLLLKSSIFRELVEKTSTVTEGDETKQDERKKPLPSVGKKEKGEFVNENVGSIPYGCCSNSRRLPGLVSEGEDALPLHNRKRAVPFEWCLNHPLR